MRTPVFSSVLAVSIGAAIAGSWSFAQSRESSLEPAWKVPQVIAFIALKKGDQVADIVAKLHPELLREIRSLAAQLPNIVVSDEPVASPLPAGLDAVIIRQNYHDLYDKHMAPVDVAVFNKGVFSALKPGGVYIVLDHAARAGSGIGATDTLHRIDPARVKTDVLAAGFELDAESSMLANPSDDHTKSVFDPSVRHHTDQFLYRFRKPR